MGAIERPHVVEHIELQEIVVNVDPVAIEIAINDGGHWEDDETAIVIRQVSYNYMYMSLLTIPQTRYVESMPMSEITPVTIWYIYPPHYGQRERSYSQPSILLIHFLFISHQSDHFWDRTILKFGKSKVKVMNEVKVQGHIVYPVSNRCTSFLFHINRTNHSCDIPASVWSWKNTSKFFLKENSSKKVSYGISPKSNQVISMTRGIKMTCFVVIGWMLLTLSCRQANFCFNQCDSHELGSRSQGDLMTGCLNYVYHY